MKALNIHRQSKQNILLLTIIITISLLSLSSSQDFSYYYDNLLNKISFPLYMNNSTKLLSSKEINSESLLSSSNKEKEYKIKTKNGDINIEYYNIVLNNTLSSNITLIKATKTNSFSEIIMDLSVTSENIYPEAYSKFFSVVQSRKASKEKSKNENIKIYNTFGFEIINNQKLNYDLDKVILLTYSDGEINYLINLYGEVSKIENNQDKDLYAFYLTNLPEKFDLQITLDLKDNEGNSIGEKVLINKKKFHYPNYKVEDDNPNKKMFIISMIFICLFFVITLIFIILTIFFICNKKK